MRSTKREWAWVKAMSFSMRLKAMSGLAWRGEEERRFNACKGYLWTGYCSDRPEKKFQQLFFFTREMEEERTKEIEVADGDGDVLVPQQIAVVKAVSVTRYEL
jgi:hypothetical protein